MKLFTKTLAATTIAIGLAACGSDNKDNNQNTDKGAVVYADNATVTGVSETVEIRNIHGDTEKVHIEAYKGIRFASG